MFEIAKWRKCSLRIVRRVVVVFGHDEEDVFGVFCHRGLDSDPSVQWVDAELENGRHPVVRQNGCGCKCCDGFLTRSVSTVSI